MKTLEAWHPVQIDPARTDYLECIKWCQEQFGSAPTPNLFVGRDWLYSPSGRSHFEFKHERDAVAFALRWS